MSTDLAFNGGWVRRGGVLKPVPPTPEPPPSQPQPVGVQLPQFTELVIETAARAATQRALNKAHARFNRGVRDAKTIAENREWNRRYRAQYRAAQREKGTTSERIRSTCRVLADPCWHCRDPVRARGD